MREGAFDMKFQVSIILKFHIYIINMNKSETSIQKGGRITMNETYGEIVVIPVNGGDTIIRG